MLNSFTWSHALDNASSTLEANTPDPQDGNNLNGDYGQSDYNLPVDNVTSLVYDLPVGQGRRFMGSSNSAVNAVIGEMCIRDREKTMVMPICCSAWPMKLRRPRSRSSKKPTTVGGRTRGSVNRPSIQDVYKRQRL